MSYEEQIESIQLPPFFDMGILLNSSKSLQQILPFYQESGFRGSLLLPYRYDPSDNIHGIKYLFEELKKHDFHLEMAVSIIDKESSANDLRFNNLADYRLPYEQSPFLKILFNPLFDQVHYNPDISFQSMKKASEYDCVYVSFADDIRLHLNGEMNQGQTSFELGLKGMPSISEEIVLAQKIELARETGCKLHILQISSERSVQLVRRAKKDGINITAGVNPAHLIFTEMACSGHNHRFKMRPPLRSENDRQALIQAIKEGTIDCLATGLFEQSHAERNFSDAPFSSLPPHYCIPLLLISCIENKELSLDDLIRIGHQRPCEILEVKFPERVNTIRYDKKLFTQFLNGVIPWAQ